MSNINEFPSTTMDEFISEVQQELSVACAIPFSVPIKEIERIIKYAAEWFYKKYEDAVEERYYIVPKTKFQTTEYKVNRTVTLPECVFSVFQLKALNEDFGGGGSSLSYDGTPDFGVEKLFLSNSLGGGFQTEDLMYYTLNMYWLDVASHLLTHTISYNYNRMSNKLFFGGETPTRDCVALTYSKLPIEYLMQDEVFYRYVVAKSKIQLSRILGTFNFNLPGGYQINYDLIRSEGQEEIQNITEEIKNEEGMDFFFTTGGA